MKKLLAFLAFFYLSTGSAQADPRQDAAALFQEGLEYFYGRGVEPDKRKGCDLFHEAASHGLPSAQFNLGNCYHDGAGREPSLDQAIAWYERAVEAGLAEAKNRLAVIYLFEAPDRRKSARAIKLLDEAIAQGDLIAPLTLGFAYFTGKGVGRDERKALVYYAAAAKRGHILAQALLYHIHKEGLYGLRPDETAAAYWKDQFHTNRAPYFSSEWTMAHMLAAAYENGWGVPKDEEKAARFRALENNQALEPTGGRVVALPPAAQGSR